MFSVSGVLTTTLMLWGKYEERKRLENPTTYGSLSLAIAQSAETTLAAPPEVGGLVETAGQRILGQTHVSTHQFHALGKNSFQDVFG